MKYVTSLLFVLLVSLALAFGQTNSGANTTGGTDNGTAATAPAQSDTGGAAATQQANPKTGEQAPATTGEEHHHGKKGAAGGNMPKTASPLAELALLGLSSLGAGALLRRRRKV
jgi:LPXTG-motif cell wall-anchored protein